MLGSLNATLIRVVLLSLSKLPGKASSMVRVIRHKRLFMLGEKDGLLTA